MVCICGGVFSSVMLSVSDVLHKRWTHHRLVLQSCLRGADLCTVLSRTPVTERVDGRNGEQVRPLRYHLNSQPDVLPTPPQKEVTMETQQPAPELSSPDSKRRSCSLNQVSWTRVSDAFQDSRYHSSPSFSKNPHLSLESAHLPRWSGLLMFMTGLIYNQILCEKQLPPSTFMVVKLRKRKATDDWWHQFNNFHFWYVWEQDKSDAFWGAGQTANHIRPTASLDHQSLLGQ